MKCYLHLQLGNSIAPQASSQIFAQLTPVSSVEQFWSTTRWHRARKAAEGYLHMKVWDTWGKHIVKHQVQKWFPYRYQDMDPGRIFNQRFFQKTDYTWMSNTQGHVLLPLVPWSFKEIIPVSQFPYENGSEAFFVLYFLKVYSKADYFEKISVPNQHFFQNWTWVGKSLQWNFTLIF